MTIMTMLDQKKTHGFETTFRYAKDIIVIFISIGFFKEIMPFFRPSKSVDPLNNDAIMRVQSGSLVLLDSTLLAHMTFQELESEIPMDTF